MINWRVFHKFLRSNTNFLDLILLYRSHQASSTFACMALVALYGCGYNAHGQLSGERAENYPPDLLHPQCLLVAETIRVIYAGWGDTVCEFADIIIWV
jgi:hypothetical protein